MSRKQGEASPGRLDRAVVVVVPELTRSRAAALIKEGHVRVDGEVVLKPSKIVDVGMQILVDVPVARPDRAEPQDLPLRILYEDPDLAVVDKDPGRVVHPGPGHPDGTLVNALLFHLSGLSGIGGVERPGIVHRLDKGTSGLLVVAKNDAAHLAISAQFADRTAGREYLALCLGLPSSEAGVVRNTLGRHPVHRLKFTAREQGKPAATHWRVVARGDGVSLIRCRLETGRTHQVRVHLSELGFPLVGDPLYGPHEKRLPPSLRGQLPPDRPMLHAVELHLIHPSTGAACSWEAPVPMDFREACARVGITTL